VTSASVCKRPKGFEGPLPVKEVTVLDYYRPPTYNTIEPLMKIVVQMRTVR